MHLNFGYSVNTGDLMDITNLIPSNHIPLGIGFTFPYGIFVEALADSASYKNNISLLNNPKWIAVGRTLELTQGIRILGSFELGTWGTGTWGTGEPAIHHWRKRPSDRYSLDIGLNFEMPLPPTKIVPGAPNGLIKGTVWEVNTGIRILAQITFPKIDMSVITNRRGEYKIYLLPGRYLLKFKVRGYKAITKIIEVEADKEIQADFELEPLR